MFKPFVGLLAALAYVAFLHPALVLGQAPPYENGPELYKQHCAICHEASQTTHAPDLGAIREISPEAVLQALDSGGIMEKPGKSLSLEEKRILASYVTGKELGTSASAFPPSAFCNASDSGASSSFDGAYWKGWGVDNENTRFQPEPMAKLGPADVPKLKLKWAFAFPDAFRSIAQPTIVGRHLFVGGGFTRIVYSLDAESGCINWTFEAKSAVRSAIDVAKPNPNGPLLMYFGDLESNVYALDAVSGQVVWMTLAETTHPYGRVTGSVKVYGGTVFVPITSGGGGRSEEEAAMDPKYECCKASGAVVALDATTGKQVWKTLTIPEGAKKTGVNAIGVPTWGPSGAGVWSSPTLDLKRKAIYVGTGDNHSLPVSSTSDAILALDMKTGKLLWSKQFTIGDTYTSPCGSADETNCPKPEGPDFDFGSSTILVNLANGKRALIAGQKSGIVHALDPDNKGAVVWETRVGKGGPEGGIQWGMASDGKLVYAPISDIELRMRGPDEEKGPTRHIVANPNAGGGLFALDVATGRAAWHAPPVLCAPGRAHCSSAQPAAATSIPGVVFSGSMDGHMRAYSTEDGSVFWDYDTAREFETVDGTEGHGGSIDGPGPVVVNGVVYVNSGNGTSNVMPGNVLLAFSAQ